MVNVILVSHGSYAVGLRDAAEMILGEQENLDALGVFPGDTLDAFTAKVENSINGFNDPDNTLIMADFFGGTPSNATMMMVIKHHVHALIGCNLPMLIDVLSMRSELGVEDLKREALVIGRNGIRDPEEVLVGEGRG